MDPVGPWSAYAAFNNRLANASGFQNSGGSSEIHHHAGGGVQATPSSTSQLLAAHASSGLSGPAPSPFPSTGFLSPPPVGYDPVFTPLFHQKAHYGIQHRPIKQTEAENYNQMTPNSYFDQNNGTPIPWSQSNPQLPSPFGILPHESVVSSSGMPPKTYENFNAHFAAAQTLNQLTDYKNSPFIDPKKRPSSPTKSISSAAPFFQQMLTSSDSNLNFKQSDYSLKNFQNGHIQQPCNISSPPLTSKEYRLPQAPRVQFSHQRNEKPRSFTPKQLNPQKHSSKAYDSDKQSEIESQSSPISFAMIDSQRNFANNKRPQQFQHIPTQQNYRFPMTPESDYQRSKSTESFGSTSSNPECNIGLPRRPSPLHTQPSPSAHVQSPVYPIYNSPLTTISSPSPVQHESCFNKQQADIPPPLDVSVSRNNVPNSVITRTDSRYDRQDYSKLQWDDRQRRYVGYDIQSNHSRQQYYDPGHQVTLQDLSSCRGDPMSLVKTLQQQQPEKIPEEKPKKRRKSGEKPVDSEYLSRVPPPAHHNTNQNGYFDIERWNLAPAPGKIFSTSPVAFNGQSNTTTNYPNSQPQSLMVSPSGPPPLYFSSFHLQQSQQPENPEPVELEREETKVIVPNIAEELQCLLENDIEEFIPRRPITTNPSSGFMSSFIKFLQGEKESSPPPSVKPVRTILKQNVYLLTEPKESSLSDVSVVPEFPSDPQDDPRYFPLPKSSDNRNFNSSDECSENEFSVNSNVEKKIETPPTSVQNEISTHAVETSIQKPKKKEKKHHKNRKKKKRSKSNESPEAVVTRREMRKRKAKEKSYPLLLDDIETENSVLGLQDTDSDPVCSPQRNMLEDDEIKNKRVTLIRSRKQSKSRSFSSSDEEISERTIKRSKTKNLCSSKKTYGRQLRKSSSQFIYPSNPSFHSGSKTNKFPFNVGEFVILKSDSHLRHPPIWRVTEKSMLQQYLHFIENGMSLYKNHTFFTGWRLESKNTYKGVIVKIVSSTKQNIVVQLISNDFQYLVPYDRNLVENYRQQTNTYFENFEIYLQTLISQSLYDNFLQEIFTEEDEYFLANVRAIESVVSDLLERFLDVLSWPKNIIFTIKNYPSYNRHPKGGEDCHCGTEGCMSVVFSGNTYNKDNLQEFPIVKTDSPLAFVLCRECLSKAEILHKLCHFKCSLYALCNEKVMGAKDNYSGKDIDDIKTIILEKLLNNEHWIVKYSSNRKSDIDVVLITQFLKNVYRFCLVDVEAHCMFRKPIWSPFGIALHHSELNVFKSVQSDWAYTDAVIRKLSTVQASLP